MQIHLRKGYHNIVLLEFSVNYPSDLALNLPDPKGVFRIEQHFKVQRGISKIDQPSLHHVTVRDIGMLECTFFKNFDHQINVTTIGYPDTHPETRFFRLMAPVDHFVGRYQ